MKKTEEIPFVVSEEVATAIREGRGVVALETTIVVHGLPAPANLEVAGCHCICHCRSNRRSYWHICRC